MRHDFLDRYSRLDSPIHRVPTGWKVAIALALVTLAVVMRPGWGTMVIAAVLVGAAAASTIPPRFILRRLLLLEPMVVGIAFLNVLRPGGLDAMLSVLFRSTVCLLAMILLANTTPFEALLGLMRRIRFPALVVTMFALLYRYLFVLIDEAERMNRARASRTFVKRRSTLWRMLGMVVGQLFVRSTERADRIYAAMCARGWK